MHVPWNWIKQRPHFIAEKLSNFYNINVFCPEPLIDFHKKLVNNKNTLKNLNIINLLKIPLSRKINILNKIETFYNKSILNNYINQSDIIWLTAPENFNVILKYVKNQKIVYDCMDDFLEFPAIKNNEILYKKYFELEKLLVNKCDLIICSSKYLKYKLINKYNIVEQKISIINNAIELNEEKTNYFTQQIQQYYDLEYLKMAYVGTISKWFDFDLILESIEKYQNICYYLFGPTEVSIPKNNRIKYFGSKNHSEIFRIMSEADALIMPFLPNELVYSINPVKLYEYIYCCKPILCLKYPETERFENYVYLYKEHSEYLEYINKLNDKKLELKQDKNQYINFVLSNTWDYRIKNIIESLNLL